MLVFHDSYIIRVCVECDFGMVEKVFNPLTKNLNLDLKELIGPKTMYYLEELCHTVVYFKTDYVFVPCFSSVSVSPSMSVKPVSRWEMHAGSCTAWSTVSSLMARCPVTRPLEAEMTPSTPSSARLAPASTFPGLSLLIWSQP